MIQHSGSYSISKVLSANDTGETGGHQAGILIPKDNDILSFFPTLSHLNEKNPRVRLTFTDAGGDKWNFNFIYYNNKFYGGTRNEFRLTEMTKYIRTNNLNAGDTIILHRNKSGDRFIEHQRSGSQQVAHVSESEQNYTVRLKLSHTWKIISC
ncbi:MAG: EcoRII N-terminal effector-binding domain-containing protein [Syntrophomonadaceae bacterium]|nr:EcoRII N-terminal effector-binding domain-containing protein [Syntrophomonadaceae bacterium]